MTDAQFPDVDRSVIHHYVLGTGYPLVCLHSLGGSGDDWAEVVPILSQHFCVHVLDLPGFGKSLVPENVKSPYQSAANFLYQYLEMLEIDRAILMGHSMGGGIALEFAVEFPSKTTALVIVDTSGLGRDLPLVGRILSHPVVASLLVQPVPFLIRAMWKSMFYDANLVSSQMIARTKVWLSSRAARRFYRQVMAAGIGLSGQKLLLTGRISSVQAPTLIVWGEQDGVLPTSHAITAHHAIPGSKLCVLPDCGHMPQLEKPAEFSETVIEFLSTLLSGREV